MIIWCLAFHDSLPNEKYLTLWPTELKPLAGFLLFLIPTQEKN